MYDQATLIQLWEHGRCGFLDLIVLDSFPELLWHVGVTQDQAAAGVFPNNQRPRWRHIRWGGVEQKLCHLVNSERLTFPLACLEMFSFLKIKWTNCMLGYQRCGTFRAAPGCVSVKHD